MRQRKLKWADEFMAKTPVLIRDFPLDIKEGTDLEIGTGKGKFIIKKAKAFPNKNFIGIDIQFSCLAVACKKAENEQISNVKYCYLNARQLPDFINGKFDNIYLNFSDPWPKKRYEKRRLTSPIFLDVYYKLLKEKGRVYFRSDNKFLYDYSVQILNESDKFKIVEQEENVPYNKEDIISEYEEKFRGLGNPIYKITFERR